MYVLHTYLTLVQSLFSSSLYQPLPPEAGWYTRHSLVGLPDRRRRQASRHQRRSGGVSCRLGASVLDRTWVATGCQSTDTGPQVVLPIVQNVQATTRETTDTSSEGLNSETQSQSRTARGVQQSGLSLAEGGWRQGLGLGDLRDLRDLANLDSGSHAVVCERAVKY